MQTMSSDQQQQMYYNSSAAAAAAAAAAGHPSSTPFFIPQTDFQPGMRPPNIYTQRMPQPQYLSQGMGNPMQAVYHVQGSPYLPQPPFVPSNNPRAMTQQYMSMPRTANDNLNNQMNFMSPAAYQAYGNSNLSPTTQIYQPQFFPASYPVQANYAQQAPQMGNAPQIPTQAQQYTLTSNFNPVQAQQQMPQAAPAQHQQIDASHIPTSQPGGTVPAPANEKRQRKPLAIVNPETKAEIQVAGSASLPATAAPTTSETRSVESSTTDSNNSVPPVKPTENNSKIQDDFRRQVAEKIGKSNDETSSGALTTKTTAAASRGKSPTPVASSTSKESTTSQASSNDLASHAYPGIRTGNIRDEKLETKVNLDETSKATVNEVTSQLESVQISQTPSSTAPKVDPVLSTSESLECVTPPQTPTVKSGPVPISSSSTSQRLRYDRDELIRIRDSSSSLSVPGNLPDLDIIINRRDNPRFPYPTSYTGTNSHGRLNPAFNRQLSGNNHPSLTRYPNNAAQDSRRKTGGIYIANEPDFGNRVDKPYKPQDQTKIDANVKVLRDIKAILNKVTPQTYEKLQKQLEALEVDRYERLEGMITIFFSKAVDEPAFSFLYARLCKQFQKKQVTVPNEEGKPVTYFFRQILLTRCQKEFENDYRQEIEYEKRKAEVDIITDEKKRKEEAEKLEEDLVKAKRRKLGNIFFIGELFKLQMLTDTIMYDCIEYLLRDKSDEESLECLCRLLRTIGKELDGKASEKLTNKNNLERHYRELEQIIREQKTSARIRFMIQDLMELRQASWVARRAEAKPMTIDEIHEEERLKRQQQERDQERDRQQRRDPNRPMVIGTAYSGGNQQQQYNDSRGSRGSGMKTQNNRNDDDRVENRFNVNSLRQLQSNDKRGQGPLAMNLAPQRTWAKGSGIEKKPEEDPSFTNRSGGKPPAGPVQQLKGKSGSSQGNASGYPLQRQSSRELARENSQRDRENALLSLRKTTTGSGVNSPGNAAGGSSSMANSREGSRNVSREQSRNTSRESSVSERTSNASLTARLSKTSALDSSTIINADPSATSFDEEKTQARVHSLIEEYTENYSDSSDRPVKEALEDLAAFRTSNVDQQATIVRELFINVLEAKPRARKAVGHLLDAALSEELLSADAFISGFKMLVEFTPDYAVDIPLIWQYIGEILGACIGAPSSNLALLKPILQNLPSDKSKQLFQYVIRYATDFSSQSHLQKLWHSSNLSLDELLKSDLIDGSMVSDYQWLTEGSLEQSKENLSPHADPQLVKLFKSFTDQPTPVTDAEIIAYIQQHMDPTEKFYIRNIVLSYLEACLINRDPQKKIQEDIANKRMTVLNAIIQHKPEAELQAVYAIQNFVNKLEHPPKMARLLFDIFYDEECVSEDAFFDWLKQPDPSETEGHAVVEMSTKDFFTWLQQAETEQEEGEEEAN